ncbi:glycoside hydrolase family 88 protein [Croceibacterium ferulae]|uniref:glycoside hydrolase family 88 protein n=1 Tax=Croceibacterium ferulae TaxID=1854641 RepID=UPI0019D4D284|nr:glycoside hydrolase family 88 protein [Croceibacterium ferulae]
MRASRRRGMRVLGAMLLAGAIPLPAIAQTDQPVVAGVEAAWLDALPRPALDTTGARLPTRAEALAAAEYVNSAQIADMARQPIPLSTGGALDSMAPNWVAAIYYTGAARLARVSDRPETLRFLTMVADHYNYAVRGAKSGPTMLNADDIAVGDLYEELYSRRRIEGTLLPLQQRLDWQVPHLARADSADGSGPLIWWWADALYMAPPVLARMSAITGNPKYLQAADKEWRRTARRLWVPEDRLFLRDERFAGRTGADGQPVYWSRGNGWVLGGLARFIEAMPADFAGREYYLDLFRQLAGRVVELQRPDGLWPASLLAPDAYPEPETSGSALFTYALAWGVNHGLLDRATVTPHVQRGWAALNRHILPDGQLGHAQRTGDQPVNTSAEDTGPYANGAYILASLELADLASGKQQPLPEPEPERDSAEWIAATMPAPPAPKTVVGDAEIARRRAEMQAVEALSYDPAASGRPQSVEPLTPPPPAERTPRAVARFAPDRLDDLLWENDLVAHRIYGPALQVKEAPSGSGIDAWAKRVRYPFMDRQLKFPNYHIDRGEGLDFYDVGRSRGTGGLGIWYDNKLWTSRNFATYDIAETGGDVARFTATYRPWPVDVVRTVAETREFTLPLGTHFTRMRSTMTSSSDEPLIVGIGIGKANGAGTLRTDQATGRMIFWEAEDADHGALGIAIAVDPAMVVGFTQDAENYLVLVRVQPGTPFTYYMGSAWNRGGDVPDQAAWEALVAREEFEF